MKRSLFLPIVFLCFCVASIYATGAKERAQNEVVVYAYDSFVAEWGAAPEIAKLFEAETGYRVNFVSCGDAAQVLSRAMIEKKAPKADVLLGIDNQLFYKAKDADILQAYKPAGADLLVPKNLLFDGSWLLTPYDWSHFALIWNSTMGVPAPTCLEDLTKDIYRKKIILMDPRTSTPGLGFVSWVAEVYGDKAEDFWKRLKPNILTLAPGWDAGYGLFSAGEAPLVISYTTSPAYHVEYDGTEQFKALIFAEGHPMQVEGAGIVKNAPNLAGAQAFMDFLITKTAQSALPLTQWMYPVNEGVTLPDCYRAAPKAQKSFAPKTARELDACVATMMRALQ